MKEVYCYDKGAYPDYRAAERNDDLRLLGTYSNLIVASVAVSAARVGASAVRSSTDLAFAIRVGSTTVEGYAMFADAWHKAGGA